MNAGIACVGFYVTFNLVFQAISFKKCMTKDYAELEPQLRRLVRKTHVLDLALIVPYELVFLCVLLSDYVPALQGTLSGEVGSPLMVQVVFWILFYMLLPIMVATAFLRRMLCASAQKGDVREAADAALKGNGVAWGFLVVAGVAFVGLLVAAVSVPSVGAWLETNPIVSALLAAVFLVTLLVAAARIVAAYVARHVLLSA